MDWSHAFGIDGMGPMAEAMHMQPYACNLLISQCLTLVCVLSNSLSIVFSVSLNEISSVLSTDLHDAHK